MPALQIVPYINYTIPMNSKQQQGRIHLHSLTRTVTGVPFPHIRCQLMFVLLCVVGSVGLAWSFPANCPLNFCTGGPVFSRPPECLAGCF